MTSVQKYTIELVTFDIAGTTLEDKNMIENAFSKAFETHSIPATYQELVPFRGSAKRPIIEEMIRRHRPDGTPELVEATMATFQECLFAAIRADAKPVPGAEGTFDWLRERGIKIGITTGLDSPTKNLVLETLGWGPDVIDVAVCSDEVPASRPAPWMIFRAMEAVDVQEATRVMAVGDTPRDLQAGARAGCGGIVGVLSGSHDAVSLGRYRHTHIIPSVADLPVLMDNEFACP